MQKNPQFFTVFDALVGKHHGALFRQRGTVIPRKVLQGSKAIRRFGGDGGPFFHPEFRRAGLALHLFYDAVGAVTKVMVVHPKPAAQSDGLPVGHQQSLHGPGGILYHGQGLPRPVRRQLLHPVLPAGHDLSAAVVFQKIPHGLHRRIVFRPLRGQQEIPLCDRRGRLLRRGTALSVHGGLRFLPPAPRQQRQRQQYRQHSFHLHHLLQFPTDDAGKRFPVFSNLYKKSQKFFQLPCLHFSIPSATIQVQAKNDSCNVVPRARADTYHSLFF